MNRSNQSVRSNMSEELKDNFSDKDDDKLSMHSGGNSEERKKEMKDGKYKKRSQFARIDTLRKVDRIKKKNES